MPPLPTASATSESLSTTIIDRHNGDSASKRRWEPTELLALLIPVLATIVSARGLLRYWDDGAITAAFAQTYAKTGRYALTPLSQQVEGFSSLLWMHLLAAPFHLTTLTPLRILLWMKLLAGLSFLGTLLVLHIWLRSTGVSAQVRGWSILLFASLSTPSIETLNGMEMNLCALITVGLVWALWKDTASSRVGLVLLSAALLGIRFEAPFTVIALCTAGLYARRSKPSAAILAGSGFIWFLLLEIYRRHIFGLLMPNTVYAKRWAPYTKPGLFGAVRSRAFSEGELVFLAGFLILLTVYLAMRSPSAVKTARESNPLRFSFVFVLFAIAFQAALGNNWGHNGRMVEQYLPFMTLFAAAFVELAAPATQRQRLWTGMWAVQLLVFVGYFYYREIRVPLIPVQTPYAKGMKVDQLRSVLGKPSMVFLTPDIGGAALCCTDLDIQDSAMLANQDLAKHGWTQFPAMLTALRPDVIETHEIWSQDSHIYDGSLLANYRPALIGGTRFLLREDIAQGLLVHSATQQPLTATPACAGVDAVDIEASSRWSTCLVYPGASR